jgi:F0F1-type ATP synthase gamma subunit
VKHALTLEYNKARQEKITYEIADMVTARMTMG